jgi:hypothetical protein
MTIKFYADTHIARAVAFQLSQRGFDVIRCEEVGMALAGILNTLRMLPNRAVQ